MPASRNAASSGRFHDQRHMDCGVVHKEPVLVFAMFPKRLAVIAECDDQRRIIKAVLLEPCHQVSELVIRVSDLTIVEVAAVFRAVGFRRIVWAVRVVKVQPEKKWASRSLLQPGDGMRYALSGATVHQPGILFLEGFRRKRVIVKIEAACQPPTPVEHEGADHGSGGVTRVLESLGHGAKLLRQRLPGEILYAVLKGVSAGQDHRMRGPGKWDLRDRPLKHDTVVSQRVKGWSLDGLRSIASHVVGTQGIDGDQYNAGFRKTGSRQLFCRPWLGLNSLRESCDAESRHDRNHRQQKSR